MKIEELKKELEKLKEFKTKREESMFYFKAQMERAEPKTAREAEDLQRAKETFEKLYREELSCLEEENKNLNIKVASLEWEIKWLNSVIDKLKEENQTLELWLDNKEKLNEEYRKQIDKLKLDGDECYQAMIFENDEVWFWKREMKKHKPNLIKEEYVFNLWDYDYMILTSTTPQLKIIKKNNKWASTFTIDWFTAVGKTFSSLTDEEDLYEDVK